MTLLSGTIYIVDDDLSLRKSLSRLLRAHGYQTEVYENADTFMAAGPAERTGCIILDLHMPGVNGLALQETLVQASCRMPILFLTARGDVQNCAQAFKAGAADFLTKPVDEAILLQGVEKALRENHRLEQQYAETAAIRQRMDDLTEREREVMRHLITGALNKQIGADLNITEKTVKVHRGRVLEKMHVTSVAELVSLCAAVGISPANGTKVQ